MNELIQLGVDLYHGKVTEFSKADAEEAFRKELLALCGGKVDYKSMRENSAKVFRLIEETLDKIIPNVLDAQFDRFVETRNVNYGDSPIFEIKDPSLFRVASIARGTGDIRRQRLDKGFLRVDTDFKGVKIYDELYKFLN